MPVEMARGAPDALQLPSCCSLGESAGSRDLRATHANASNREHKKLTIAPWQHMVELFQRNIRVQSTASLTNCAALIAETPKLASIGGHQRIDETGDQNFKVVCCTPDLQLNLDVEPFRMQLQL